MNALRQGNLVHQKGYAGGNRLGGKCRLSVALFQRGYRAVVNGRVGPRMESKARPAMWIENYDACLASG